MNNETKKSLRNEILNDIKQEISPQEQDINAFGKLIEILIENCISESKADIGKLEEKIMTSERYLRLVKVYPKFDRTFVRGYIWRCLEVIGKINLNRITEIKTKY